MATTTSTGSSSASTTNHTLISCDFEIFGKVQGVFFRKYTQQEATKLKLAGWVKNTESGTVQGHMEGPKNEVMKMKTWLQSKGSPKSKITKANFTNETTISQVNGHEFTVIK